MQLSWVFTLAFATLIAAISAAWVQSNLLASTDFEVYTHYGDSWIDSIFFAAYYSLLL